MLLYLLELSITSYDATAECYVQAAICTGSVVPLCVCVCGITRGELCMIPGTTSYV